LANLSIYGFLDPALGRGARAGGAGEGDYAAIATVGVDGGGRLYALDIWLERASPTRQILKLFDLHERWAYTRFGVETNAFQHVLLDRVEAERDARRLRGEVSDLPVEGVSQHIAKELRIFGLEPRIGSGGLLLNAELDERFIEQLTDFPAAGHDDGPDALASAVALALGDYQAAVGVAQAQRPPRQGKF
jgi:predicted phage terminase large subunit-like protein